jgi:predicted nucleic-acid-binding protein
MKVKKAIKRLHRVETILTTVIERYAGRKSALRDLLDSAKGRVVRATETLTVPNSTRKPPAKAVGRRKGNGRSLRESA